MPVPCKALISYNVANIILGNISPRVQRNLEMLRKISAIINLELKNSEKTGQIGNTKNSGEIRDICNTGFLHSHVEIKALWTMATAMRGSVLYWIHRDN